jgi:hypothetical protein
LHPNLVSGIRKHDQNHFQAKKNLSKKETLRFPTFKFLFANKVVATTYRAPIIVELTSSKGLSIKNCVQQTTKQNGKYYYYSFASINAALRRTPKGKDCLYG